MLSVALLGTAGCGQEGVQKRRVADVDVNAAANAARGEIDTYAAATLQSPREAAVSPAVPAGPSHAVEQAAPEADENARPAYALETPLEQSNDAQAAGIEPPGSGTITNLTDGAVPTISATANLPATADADYRCTDGTRFHAHFDNDANVAVLGLPGGTVTLAGQPAASGIRYAARGYGLRGKGEAASLTVPGGTARSCTAEPPAPTLAIRDRTG